MSGILPDLDVAIPGTNGVTRRRAIIFLARFFTRAPVVVLKTLLFGPAIKSPRWNRRDWLIVALFQDMLSYPDLSPQPLQQTNPRGSQTAQSAPPQLQVLEAEAASRDTAKAKGRAEKSLFQNKDLPTAKGLGLSKVLIEPNEEFLQPPIRPYKYTSRHGTEEEITPQTVKAVWVASSRHDPAVDDYLDLEPLIRSRVRQSLEKGNIPQGQALAIIHFHGGGYISGKELIHSAMSTCARTGAYILYVNYRLAFRTRNTYPAGLQDAATAFAYLVRDIGIPAQYVGIMGDSAGGGLSLALTLYLKDCNLPMPEIQMVDIFKPWVDLTLSQPSTDHSPHDYIQKKNTRYASGRYTRHDESLLTHPYASPFWYNWSKLREQERNADWPATFVIWGAEELFADEDRVLVEKMKEEGGLSDKVIGLAWPDMIHDFTLLPIKEAVKGQRCIADFFLDRTLRGPNAASL